MGTTILENVGRARAAGPEPFQLTDVGGSLIFYQDDRATWHERVGCDQAIDGCPVVTNNSKIGGLEMALCGTGASFDSPDAPHVGTVWCGKTSSGLLHQEESSLLP